MTKAEHAAAIEELCYDAAKLFLSLCSGTYAKERRAGIPLRKVSLCGGAIWRRVLPSPSAMSKGQIKATINGKFRDIRIRLLIMRIVSNRVRKGEQGRLEKKVKERAGIEDS